MTDAVRVEQPEAGKRRPLGLGENARKPRADRREGRIGARPARHRGRAPRMPSTARSRLRLDRPVAASLGRRHRASAGIGRAELVRRQAGLAHLSRIDRGQHRALRDQLGLGLADQLVLVEPEEEQPDQRQRHHRRAGWRARRGRGAAAISCAAHAPHLPSRKPTPCTVSIASAQPAAANLARMLRMWLSTVRSATWMLAA